MTEEAAKAGGLAGRVAAAVGDQGLVSAANFGLNLALARWAGAEEFGAYAAAFSGFLFLAGAHSALVRDPCLVLGAPLARPDQLRLLGAEVLLHFLLTVSVAAIGVGLTLALAAGFSWSVMLVASFVAAALTLPTLLLYWLARQGAYLLGRPAVAAFSSGLYAALVVAGAAGLVVSGRASAWSFFLVQGGAGLVAGAVGLHRLGVRGRHLTVGNFRAQARRLGRAQWEYGRWVLASAVVDWGATAAFAPLLAAFISLPAAGAFRALEQLFLPVTRVLQAGVLLAIPELARRFADQGARALRRPGLILTGVSLLALAAWSVVPLAAPERVVEVVFGAEYVAYSPLVFWIAVATAFTTVRLWLDALSRAAVAPKLSFFAQLAATAVILVLARGLLEAYGAVGAAYLAAGSAAAGAFVLAVGWLVFERRAGTDS